MVHCFCRTKITIKTMLKGYRVGEVGIQTFPREFGRGASATPTNIIASIGDTVRTYRTIFQADYDLPANRSR
jgi:hypothetical protein